jgi:uncharacterized LabA/DUF88 family protein
MDRQNSTSDYRECYIFIDDSNIWIEGQKAQGQALQDADSDPRFRVDLGRFVKMVKGDRNIAKAFLYGSIPPPNDSVWNAARKMNFKVQVFERSCGGKEKEVDVAMASDITEQVVELNYIDTDCVFVIVTGDRDLKRPIDKVLKRSVPVELWSWERSLSREFRLMANTEKFLKVFKLGDFVEKFSYFAFRSTRVSSDINPACAIVFRDLPGGKEFFYKFANDLTRLLRLFYVSSVDSSAKGRKDLIVEFPHSRPDVIFSLLRQCRFQFEAINYPEYTSQREAIPPIETTNRYEALNNLDDCDNEALVEAMESSLNVEVADIVTPSTPTEHAQSGESEEDAGDWITFVRKNFKSGQKTRSQKRRDTPCQWGIHCAKNSACPYAHSEEEQKIFRVNPNTQFRYWKTKECNKLPLHTQREQQKRCPFAHSNADAWCLKCKSYGHFTNNCAV